MITAPETTEQTLSLYISQLEARVVALEGKTARLDKDWLLSPHTFKRALSVWGHMILIQAIVTAAFLLVIMFVGY